MVVLDRIAKQLLEQINNELFRIGFLFRSYYRYKSLESIEEKMIRKDYGTSGRLIQDAIGIRINLYFVDDLPNVINLIKKCFELRDEEIDHFNEDTFKPMRNNLVFNIPQEFKEEFESSIKGFKKPIDTTFEVQIRSVLSEGWHEVEHDLRYKCKKDWEEHKDLSRTLNGIYATLETGEWTMLKVFSELSYKNYRNGSWAALLRNKFRLRIKMRPKLNDELINLLDDESDLAKRIFRIERSEYLNKVVQSKLHIPLTYNNIIFTLNHVFLRNILITRLTPQILLDDLNSCFDSDLSTANYFIRED